MTATRRSKPYVFVSHAKHDKTETPMLRQVVAALVEKGLKVWLDDPRALDYSDDDIAAHFEDLRGDRRWEDQIDDALEDAACILLCVSHKFCERYAEDDFKKEGVIWRETSHALTAKKAAACRIDDVRYANIPPRVQEAQVIDLAGDPGKLDGFLNDIERIMTRTLERRLGSLGRAPARDPFLPFLANRKEQERMAKKGLADAAFARSVRALIVKAPHNEAPMPFIERLQCHTAAGVLGEGKSCSRLEVPWPRVEHEKQFGESFKTNVRDALGLRDTEEIRAKLAEQRKVPLLLFSEIDFEKEWKRRSAKLVRAWAIWWQSTAAESGPLPILPVLMITLPETPPGWKDVPSHRNARGISTRQAWKDLGKIRSDIMKRADANSFALELLDVLGPVLSGDATRWLETYNSQIGGTGSALYMKLDSEFSRMFSGKPAKTGICMKDWAHKVHPFLTPAQSPLEETSAR